MYPHDFYDLLIFPLMTLTLVVLCERCQRLFDALP